MPVSNYTKAELDKKNTRNSNFHKWPLLLKEYEPIEADYEYKTNHLLHSSNYLFIMKNILNCIDAEIVRLAKKNPGLFSKSARSKAQALEQGKQELCDFLGDKMNEPMVAVLPLLHQKIIAISQNNINQQRNLVGAFFKGLAGVLLSIPCIFIPLLVPSFRATFFHATAYKALNKIAAEVVKKERNWPLETSP